METIRVKDYQTSAGDYSSGCALLNACRSSFEKKEAITLDFEDSTGISSSFLNGFLGDAFDAYGVESIRPLLQASNISGSKISSMKKYISDYIELHSQF